MANFEGSKFESEPVKDHEQTFREEALSSLKQTEQIPARNSSQKEKVELEESREKIFGRLDGLAEEYKNEIYRSSIWRF